MNTDFQSMLGDRLRPGDILPMLRRGWWLALGSVLLCFLAAVIVSVISPREFKGTAVLRIVPSQGQEVQTKEILDVDLRGFQEVERFYRTQVQLFKSRSFAEKVATEYQTLTGEELTIKEILLGTEVFPLERSQLVEVSFTDNDPQRAADLANLVADTFVRENLEWRREIARDANRWVEERLKGVGAERALAVNALLAFKKEHDIIDRTEVGGELSARMQALENGFGRISTERVLLEARVAGHEELLRKGQYDALTALTELPLSPGLRELHAKAEADLAAVSARYGERHPEFIAATGALERIQRQVNLEVREAIRAEYAELELLRDQERRLTEERELTTSDVLTRQELEAEYRDLTRQLVQVEDTERTLLKRQQELRLSAESQLNNVYRQDAAFVPETYVRPRVSLILAAGLVLGVLLGVLLALVRGLLDETILSPADIETYIRMPLLGVVPHVDRTGVERPELLVHHEPRSSLAEAFRGIRTMVENRSDGSRMRRLLVTSSLASEGKTSVAVQLATVFAQQGRRTLLVEGDHRRPRLHGVFGYPNETGVNEIVAGTSSIAEAVRPTEVPGLFVLPRGRGSRDSVEMLTSEPMLALLAKLEGTFDMVIIDTPPSAALSDAVTMSREVDGVIMVVRSGKVSRSAVRHTVRRLQQVGANIPGIVVNDFKSTGMAGGYGYGYYYSSGYYYEEGKDDPTEGEAAK